MKPKSENRKQEQKIINGWIRQPMLNGPSPAMLLHAVLLVRRLKKESLITPRFGNVKRIL